MGQRREDVQKGQGEAGWPTEQRYIHSAGFALNLREA
ncbi:hypothetical protein QO016_002079 [Methylobacterium persicinum]|uniref:Uncharacterized protein n=1 Tax=Methylobacterium persicinum TaxID=374426 RepID=A0ABU0HLL6_9HYPH|nr:hypothetical protein [Methylobacterium persicinum]